MRRWSNSEILNNKDKYVNLLEWILHIELYVTNISRWILQSTKKATENSITTLNPETSDMFIHGHCAEVMEGMPDQSVDHETTSPPYFNAREYSQWPNLYMYLRDMLHHQWTMFQDSERRWRVFLQYWGHVWKWRNCSEPQRWVRREFSRSIHHFAFSYIADLKSSTTSFGTKVRLKAIGIKTMENLRRIINAQNC